MVITEREIVYAASLFHYYYHYYYGYDENDLQSLHRHHESLEIEKKFENNFHAGSHLEF